VATASRAESASLIEQLKKEPFNFDFCQAVQLLERLTERDARVGFFYDPAAEPVRFQVHLSLSFPASEIHTLEFDGSLQPNMTVNLMGLTGPTGVLPRHYTQLLLERQREGDPALEDFLNLFQHRLISLYYRAARRYKPAIDGDPQASGPGRALMSFAGLKTSALPNRQFIADESLLRYAVYFTRRPRSCAALEFILRDYLGVEVRVEQFAGMWYPLAPSVQWRFGGEYAEFFRAIGDEVWDVQSGVRIRLGPLSRSQYRDFLPGRNGYETVRTLIRFFASSIAFELQLVLRSTDVPECILSEPQDGAPGLGWDTWIGQRPLKQDPDDTIVSLEP